MSALTRVLRELAQEGVEVAAATRRFLTERFGDAADTPANVERVRRVVQRAEPQLPSDAANPFAVAVDRARRPAQRPLAARPQRPLAARPEVAPALPPPAEPLPEWAAKPRGGQWVTREAGGLGAVSPEQQVLNNIHLTERYQSGDPLSVAMRDWWDRALPRYIRNDFGTPTDPLRELAPQAGLVENADEWSALAAQSVVPFRIDQIVSPGLETENATGVFAEARRRMPWLARQPMTDQLYAVDLSEGGGLPFGHVADELRNALRPEVSGIPADLAVRPESLQRMSFPQAVERVGRINQWRAAQQAEASLAAMNNPALRVYREYAENNPRGLRWVEIAPPEMTDDMLPPIRDYSDPSHSLAGTPGAPRFVMEDHNGDEIVASSREQLLRGYYHPDLRQQLQDALRYEGDTMGHCVGGYCDDVLSGRSRIFSLRDARGEPHVTIEASPRGRGALSGQMLNDMERGLFDQYLAQRYEEGGIDDMHRWLAATRPELASATDIIQIKGKQNRAPNDEYLPFVQDFVRNGTWGNIGDLANTGLVRLPDGRYITQQQMEEGLASGASQLLTGGIHNPSARGAAHMMNGLPPEDWQQLAPYFEGYAVGGRVDADRCFCRHPFSAKR